MSSKNLKYTKTENNYFSTNNASKNKIKYSLMEKYNISSEQAEKIIFILKNKEKMDEVTSKGIFNENEGKLFKNTLKNNPINKSNNQISNFKNEKQDIYKEYSQKGHSNKINNSKQNSTQLNKKNQEIEYDAKHSNIKFEDVDSIISDIIPNYNQQIAIELKNVDLTFEVAIEKVDTIKEYFVRTLKRDKSKKIKICALKNISFKVYQGEKIGIIGYNGAGKSTLLNVIAGIYPPEHGSIKTNGNISPLLSLGAGFDFNFSGRKNIFLNGAVLGYDKDFLQSKVNEIIEFSELGDYIDIPIKNYSSGMLAKLGFSIATSVNPDILIIDEILGVGDVNFRKKSGDKIKSLIDGGTTVLLVSHSIPQIREICDKAIWIDNGNLREIGEVNKVCDHYLKDAEKASNEQLANIQFS